MSTLPDRTPKEIRDNLTPTAVPIRSDIVHVSKSNNESEGVLAEDLARILGAATVYSASETYKVNDFVFESGILYKNTTAITVPEVFDSTKWQVINFADLFNNGTPADDSVVLAQQSGDSTFTRHNERDISRLQSAINTYSNSKSTYNPNDTVHFQGTNYRNITAVTTGETFVPAKWDSLDGALNTIYVNDESQFPDAATEFFTHVEDNGIGDARFFFRDSLVYSDGQIADIANSTVPAYDGLHTIDKTPIFLNKIFDEVIVGNNARGVAVNEDKNKGYVANFADNTVTVFNSLTNQVITTIGGFSGPSSIVIDETLNKIYVTERSANRVAVIDGTSDTVSTTITTGIGVQPIGITRDNRTGLLYVANGTSNSISEINTTTDTATEKFTSVGDTPVEVTVDSNLNKLYASIFVDDTVAIIELSDSSLTTVSVGNQPNGIAADETTGLVFVCDSADGEVSVLDGNTNVVDTNTITVGTLNVQIVVNSSIGRAYTINQTGDSISEINISTKKVVDTITLTDASSAITVTNSTNTIYAATNGVVDDVKVISVSPTNTSNVVVPLATFSPVTVEVNNITKKGYQASLSGSVTVFDSITGEVLSTITGLNTASSVAINEKKNEIYVVSQGTNSMFVIDGNTDTLLTTITTGIGSIPVRCAFDPVNDVICIANNGDDTATLLSSVTFLELTNSPLSVELAPSNVTVNKVTGKFFVTNRSSGSVTKIDSATVTVDILSIPTGSDPTDIAVNDATDTVYTSNPGDESVDVFDGATGNPITNIVLPGVQPDPIGITVSSTTGLIYAAAFNISTIFIIDSSNVIIDTIDTSADLTNGQNPQGMTINPITDFLYVTYRISNNVTIYPPKTFDVTGLSFTTTASGDTERELSGTDAYILQIPISTAFGYKMTSPTGTFSLTSASIFENRITMTGDSTTFLTIENLTAAEVVNCEVDDGTGNNTLLNITGSGLSSFMFFTNFGAFGFDTLGTVTDAFLPMLANSFIFFNNGFVITNAKVNINSMAINSIVPGADYLTINNTTDLGLDPFFTSLSSTVPSGSTLFNINPATPVENTFVIANSGPGGTGDYFKAGTELTGVITAFADAGGGDVTVTSTAHGLVAGQSLEITNSINYNGIFAIVGTPNANDFDITATFVAETPEADTIFTQVKVIESYAANTAFAGTVDSTADNGESGTTVTDTGHGLENGTSVTISGTTNYNGTFIIFNLTGNTFDIAVAFVGDESGTWVANKTLVGVTAHGFSDGTPVLVSETVDYNKGYFVEFVSIDNFLINTPFVTDESQGVVSDASLDQTAVNVLLDTVTGQPDSMVIGGFFVEGQDLSESSATFTDFTFSPNAVALNNRERFTLVDGAIGEIRYDGLSPVDVDLVLHMGVLQDGDEITIGISFAIDRGGGYAPIPQAPEGVAGVKDPTNSATAAVSATILVNQGDKIKPQVRRILGAGTDYTITNTRFDALRIG